MKKFLLVDDDAGILLVVKLIAQRAGVGFMAVNNPLVATEAFVAYRPDIVMLDMIMPEKDGITILHEMLATGIPARFVLTSGFGESYLRLAMGVATFHGAGAPAILPKPFRRQELLALLAGTVEAAAAPQTAMQFGYTE